MEIIKSEKKAGKVFINKLAAAERQLNSAIRMYFMDEDELAIHVVASAALNVFSDLLKYRGKEPLLFPILYGFLSTAKDYYEGKLSEQNIKDAWPEGAFELIKEYSKIFQDHPDFEIDNMKIVSDPEYARQQWQKLRLSYNFLKHADRDFEKVLDLSNLNNENIILIAIGAAGFLNCELSPEKEFFWCYLWSRGKLHGKPAKGRPLQFILKQLSTEEAFHLARQELCYPRVNDEFQINFEEMTCH